MAITKRVTTIIAFLCAAISPPVFAHDDGFYLGVEAGYALVDNVPGGVTSNAAGRALGGYQFNPYFAVEVGVLGNLNNLYIVDGVVRATLPFTNETRIFIKAGYAEIVNNSFDEIFNTFTYGAGFGIGVTGPFSVDIGYQGYGDERRVDFISLGFSYHLY